MTTSAPTTFIFAGGGTGGHLFPGLAIADALAARAQATNTPLHFQFLGSSRAIDAKVMHDQGYPFRPLPAQPIALRPKGLYRFLRGWGPSIRFTRQIITDARARGSVHLVAMGGFVAAPAARAAVVERIPLTLVNLDAIPGKANRLIARRAGHVYTAAPVEGYASWIRVPPIVRNTPAALDRAAAIRALGLDPARPILLVTGGSQGAGSVNNFVQALAARAPSPLAAWQVLHQSGLTDNTALETTYRTAGITAIVRGYVPGLGSWWALADLAISRSGAGSVADAWASATPTIFMPYPFHADHHQKINARVLTGAINGGTGLGGAIVCEDRVDPNTNLATIGPVVEGLLSDQPRRDAMRAWITGLGPVDGAQRVAAGLLERP